jgi:hypothetical protein
MNTLMTDHGLASWRRRVPVAIAIASASLALMAVTFAVVHKTGSIQTNAPGTEKPESQSRAPWNLALGNVVVLARELGLETTAPDKVDPARLAARIEAQLTGLRQLYRQRSESDPALLGGMTLQITVGPSGQVVGVKILSAQLNDEDFLKALAAEAAKWNFNEIAPEGTVIDCPLLFVREGMDIATVLNWEKGLKNRRNEDVAEAIDPRPEVKKK